MSNPSRYQPWTIPILNGRIGYAETPDSDPDPEDPIDYASSDEAAAVQVAARTEIVEPADDLNLTDGTVTNGGGTAPVNFINTSLANDGSSLTKASRGSYVAASTTTHTSILKTDLGSAFMVNEVFVYGHTNNADPGWTLEHSSDGSSWTASTVTYVWNNTVKTATLTLDTPTSDRWWRIIRTQAVVALAFVHFIDVYTWSITGSSVTIGESTWFPAPAANDGDTATSANSDVLVEPTLRVYLEVERLIYRVELDIGQESAGATVYELYGTDDPTFDTGTLLATLSFTATGSFSFDTVTAAWVPDASYQYFQLVHVSGGGDSREFYEIRLFSAVGAVGVTDHPSLSGRSDAAQHPASSVTVADSAGLFSGTTVETTLAELAAKSIGYQAHGNTGTTETFDAAIGWHSATLNDNCTFTLTAATTGTASSLFLELTQDGTGGRTITLPASVVNKTDLEAEQDTTAGETTFILLLSRDGGTSWYGGWWGGDSGDLAALEAKVTGYQAHGSMGAAETFDAATGWHSGTFNANCTFTLTAAASGTASSLFLELTQDGTGGWTLTLPASVVNKASIEAAQDTTLGTTSFLVLLSRDGGTSWYGGWWGTDEDTPVGALDDLSDVEITAPADKDTLRYNGSEWVNDNRRWEPVTENPGTGPELVWDGDNLVMEWKAY